MPQRAATGETILRGIPVSTGVSVGKVLLLGQARVQIARQEIAEGEIPRQMELLEQGLLSTRQQLTEIQQQVTQAMGAKDASIFDAHLLVLDDPTLLEGVARMIAEEKVSAALNAITSNIVPQNVHHLHAQSTSSSFLPQLGHFIYLPP